MTGQCSVLDVAFCSIELPVTPWGDFLGVEKVTKDTFRRRGSRFPRLLKTSTLEPAKRNRARFPFDSFQGDGDAKKAQNFIHNQSNFENRTCRLGFLCSIIDLKHP